MFQQSLCNQIMFANVSKVIEKFEKKKMKEKPENCAHPQLFFKLNDYQINYKFM